MKNKLLSESKGRTRSLNLPNKLTILRTIMIPVFLIFLYIPGLGMTGDVFGSCNIRVSKFY